MTLRNLIESHQQYYEVGIIIVIIIIAIFYMPKLRHMETKELAHVSPAKLPSSLKQPASEVWKKEVDFKRQKEFPPDIFLSFLI